MLNSTFSLFHFFSFTSSFQSPLSYGISISGNFFVVFCYQEAPTRKPLGYFSDFWPFARMYYVFLLLFFIKTMNIL